MEAVRRLAVEERAATARLIAHLAEVDARRLYLGQGYASMFTWCTGALRLSEHAAYARIECARLVRRLPAVLVALEQGDVTLTAACLLAPALTRENCDDLLGRARHRSRREVEVLVAALRPKPDAPAIVRKLPEPKHLTPAVLRAETPAPDATPAARLSQPSTPSAAVRPPVVAPLAPERYRIQVTVSRNTYDKLRRAQGLSRHAVPNGDPAVLIDRALTLLVAELERVRFGATTKPRATMPGASRGRHVPAAVKRAVWARDDGRCGFVGVDGRCGERGRLEFHHVVPFAAGGATTIDNLQLRCRAHNQYRSGPVVRSDRQAGPGCACRGRNSVRTELSRGAS